MRAPSNIHIAGIFFIIAAGLLILTATHKTKLTPENPAISHVNTNDTNDTVTKFIEAAEKQNELERDQKEQANKLAKLIKAKRDSVECQFWMQQKHSKSTNPRINEKITQFCELPLD